jgi:hypothetical protein
MRIPFTGVESLEWRAAGGSIAAFMPGETSSGEAADPGADYGEYKRIFM